MHILLTGATGRVGAAVLHAAIQSPSISRVTVLSRRPVPLASSSPKATVIIHDDFTAYPTSLLEQLRGVSACIWALGISAVGMDEAAYTKITYDFPIAAAKALVGEAKAGKRMNFVHVSGEGVNTENKGQLYARVKGRAEKELLALQTDDLKVYNIRPGVITAKGKLMAERQVGFMDRAIDIVGAGLEMVWKGGVISTEGLAKACLVLAEGDGKAQEGAGMEQNVCH